MENHEIRLTGKNLSIRELVEVAKDGSIKVFIHPSQMSKVKESSSCLKRLIDKGRAIYGVNTSMGGMVDWLVSPSCASELQENLVSAVATNVGDYFEDSVVRGCILARLNSLARGCSGISEENLEKLISIYNQGVIPCVPIKGSLGASGDLGPLAAIALVAIGKGKAKYNGKIMEGREALKLAGIQPMKLSYKEGLSLINGTSMMVSLGAHVVDVVDKLLKLYNIISAFSFESLGAKKNPFDPRVHREKPHIGQLEISQEIFHILEQSQMIHDEVELNRSVETYKDLDPSFCPSRRVEDAYSIRCSPQILGPIVETLTWVRTIIENELNSSNDNPLIISEYEEVFHNGHFHGQYVSMAMDFLSISLTSLSNLADRRIDRFMDPKHTKGLPPFLCQENPGIRLGLMGGQFMATSVTAENRSLCTPLSIQTLTSTGDFQDVVSMGLIAARRAQEICQNTCYVVAFELLCAAQAADIQGAEKLSPITQRLHSFVREKVPYLSKDTSLTPYIEEIASAIYSGEWVEALDREQCSVSTSSC